MYDDVEDEEQLEGTFFNQLLALDLDRHQWRTVNVGGRKEPSVVKRRRRKPKEEDEAASDSESEEEPETCAPVIAADDGIFTVTLCFI